MLVLLLARPIWNQRPPTSAQRWLLIEPGVALDRAAMERARSLARAGYQTRSLVPGLPRVVLSEKTSAQPPSAPDVWSLAREADARLPSGSSLVVFASDRIASLRGERPALRSKIEWIGVPPLSEKSRVTLVSLAVVEGQLHCVIASSDPESTRHTRVTIPAATGKHSAGGFSIDVRQSEDRTWSARLLPDGDWIAAAVSQNVLVLRAPDREPDARYVAAALQAIGVTVDVQTFTSDTDATRADWIFWLNDDAVPERLKAEVTKRNADLLQDAEGSRDGAQPAVGSIVFDRPFADIQLLLRTAATGAGVRVWSDSSGAPLLTIERVGRGKHWRFFSRFHPDWNELPRSSALPAALQTLLLAASPEPKIDNRVADRAQAQPAEGGSHSLTLAATERVDLQQLFWSLAVLLFAAERALSFRSAPSAAARKSARVREENPVLV
jgi:hypothetical protein